MDEVVVERSTAHSSHFRTGSTIVYTTEVTTSGDDSQTPKVDPKGNELRERQHFSHCGCTRNFSCLDQIIGSGGMANG